jgi:NAD(P)H-flavin reductase
MKYLRQSEMYNEEQRLSNSALCELVSNFRINEEFFILQFVWEYQAPKAGQFFMVKPLRTSVFLPRPLGVFEYNAEQKTVKFLISKRGKGTQELSQLNYGEKAMLTGPVGNCWSDFLPEPVSSGMNAALVSGSAGIAPLAALAAERQDYQFDFFAGFREGFREKEEEDAIIGSGSKARKIIIAAEDGKNALIGRIVDFLFEPEKYDVILGCGPAQMLHALKLKCESKNVPCFISMESRLACGVGACLGCTINTIKGSRRCCKDGPIFPAGEVLFNV